MRNNMLTGFFVILLLSFNGCGPNDTREDSALTPEAFEEAITDSSEKIILDVRTPEEFNEGHIRNARLINFRDEDFKAEVNELDKETPVYVYCASGVRSDKAATLMREEGFREVFVLSKGFSEWVALDKEIVK